MTTNKNIFLAGNIFTPEITDYKLMFGAQFL